MLQLVLAVLMSRSLQLYGLTGVILYFVVFALKASDSVQSARVIASVECFVPKQKGADLLQYLFNFFPQFCLMWGLQSLGSAAALALLVGADVSPLLRHPEHRTSTRRPRRAIQRTKLRQLANFSVSLQSLLFPR